MLKWRGRWRRRKHLLLAPWVPVVGEGAVEGNQITRVPEGDHSMLQLDWLKISPLKCAFSCELVDSLVVGVVLPALVDLLLEQQILLLLLQVYTGALCGNGREYQVESDNMFLGAVS